MVNRTNTFVIRVTEREERKMRQKHYFIFPRMKVTDSRSTLNSKLNCNANSKTAVNQVQKKICHITFRDTTKPEVKFSLE